MEEEGIGAIGCERHDCGWKISAVFGLLGEVAYFQLAQGALTMEGRTCPEGMDQETFAEAQRLFEVTQQAMADEQWRVCLLMASKQNEHLLGPAEFELRDRVLRMGAIALEAAVNGRRKKGGIMEAASHALHANITRGSSTGEKRPSSACSE